MNLDEEYFSWLCEQIAPSRPPTFWSLFRALYTTEFTWFVPNDDNRAQEGIELRLEFCETVEGFEDWMSLECSMLEMMIALSRRLSFEIGGEPREWFWHLIDNLGMSYFTDKRASQSQDYDIKQRLAAVVQRTYDANGEGGLFPLKNPTEDQRKVEIWYQLNAYLIERTN